MDCSLYSLQLEALQKFVSDHDKELLRYNTSQKKERDLKHRRCLPGERQALPGEPVRNFRRASARRHYSGT